MSEQAFDTFDALPRAEHHDHFGLHRGFGGEFVGLRAEVAQPDPAHAGESIPTTESSPRFAVNRAD